MHRPSSDRVGLAGICIGFVAVVMLVTSIGSTKQPEQNTAGEHERTPAEDYDALIKAQREGQDKYSRAYQAAQVEQERQQVLKELGTAAAPQSYTQGHLKLIQNHPDDPVVFKAFQWLLTYDRYAEATNKAAVILTKHHSQNEQMAAVCKNLQIFPCPAGEKLMRALLEKSPHRPVQGYARYSLAGCLQSRGEWLIRNDAAPERDRLKEEAERLLEQVVKQYADLTHDSTTLGKAAAVRLFALRHLAIGKTAPEIEGEDIDGKPMKLSDYRGKVVLVSFWATWCGPCMAAVPHERSLVKRLDEKPFALLGINADQDRDAVKPVIAKEGITWPSWWDGGSASGPIASQWNISVWPTLYLLDGQGVVRYKGDYLASQGVRTDKDGKSQVVHNLDEAVDNLLKEIADAK